MKKNIFLVFALVILTTIGCAKKQTPPPQPKPAPVEAPVAAEPVVNKEPATLADVQHKLIQHGAKIKADGKMGPKTKAALKKFQKKNGLKPTGAVNKETLAKLGLA